MTFVGTALDYLDDENYKLKGTLSIKGHTKEIKFDVDYGGFGVDSVGYVKSGFSMSGRIYRKDWGLAWNTLLDWRGVLLSNEVNINAEVQFIKQS